MFCGNFKTLGTNIDLKFISLATFFQLTIRFSFPVSDYLAGLNEVQKEAAMCMNGPVMIIAGAGSGKTKVLTHRIVNLLHHQVDPFNILALTFTNKAAKSMKERIIYLVGPEANQLWMGTFHSVFSKILRFEAEKLGYTSSFTIYDNDDSKGLIRDIIKEQGLDDKKYKPETVQNRISSAKNNLFSPSDYQNSSDIQSDDRNAGKPEIGKLYEIYANRCFRANAMDFDDLLYKMFIVLHKFPDVLSKYQNKFKYILVDEYQDTNFAQYAIIKKMAAMNENICVVGDDAQSIYSFRGADIQNILNFEKDYPDLKVFKLEQNYRSTKHIVEAANSIIKNNKNQITKEVWTQNEQGEKINLYKTISDNEEGSLVASSIFQEKMNSQLSNKDFAILYRTNAQSRSIEEGLRRQNIPYRIFGGLSFYKRKEIKDMLGYFRLCINNNDEEALKRIINFPARGIGKTSLERLIVFAAEKGISIWNSMENIHEIKDINSGTRSKISEFVMMIKSFSVISQNQDAFEAASHIASHSGVLKELHADHTTEGIAKYENIQELLNGIKEFTEDTGTTYNEDGEIISIAKTLQYYIQDIALLTDADNDNPEDDNKVSLMTIHAAKGLEFNHVFLVGLEENLFPSSMSIHTREELEEERRLFYVAITRAEKKLSLSFATSRFKWGTLQSCEPSRFISEIDPRYLKANFRMDNTNEVATDLSKERASYFSKTTKPIVHKSSAPLPVDLNFIPDDASKIQVGMDVEHQRFGKGKVLSMEGAMGDLKATIFFRDYGQKQLLLKFAKLRIQKAEEN